MAGYSYLSPSQMRAVEDFRRRAGVDRRDPYTVPRLRTGGESRPTQTLASRPYMSGPELYRNLGLTNRRMGGTARAGSTPPAGMDGIAALRNAFLNYKPTPSANQYVSALSGLKDGASRGIDSILNSFSSDREQRAKEAIYNVAADRMGTGFSPGDPRNPINAARPERAVPAPVREFSTEGMENYYAKRGSPRGYDILPPSSDTSGGGVVGSMGPQQAMSRREMDMQGRPYEGGSTRVRGVNDAGVPLSAPVAAVPKRLTVADYAAQAAAGREQGLNVVREPAQGSNVSSDRVAALQQRLVESPGANVLRPLAGRVPIARGSRSAPEGYNTDPMMTDLGGGMQTGTSGAPYDAPAPAPTPAAIAAVPPTKPATAPQVATVPQAPKAPQVATVTPPVGEFRAFTPDSAMYADASVASTSAEEAAAQETVEASQKPAVKEPADPVQEPVDEKSFLDNEWVRLGLNMMVAASKPGATALGAFGEGAVATIADRDKRALINSNRRFKERLVKMDQAFERTENVEKRKLIKERIANEATRIQNDMEQFRKTHKVAVTKAQDYSAMVKARTTALEATTQINVDKQEYKEKFDGETLELKELEIFSRQEAASTRLVSEMFRLAKPSMDALAKSVTGDPDFRGYAPEKKAKVLKEAMGGLLEATGLGVGVTGDLLKTKAGSKVYEAMLVRRYGDVLNNPLALIVP